MLKNCLIEFLINSKHYHDAASLHIQHFITTFQALSFLNNKLVDSQYFEMKIPAGQIILTKNRSLHFNSVRDFLNQFTSNRIPYKLLTYYIHKKCIQSFKQITTQKFWFYSNKTFWVIKTHHQVKMKFLGGKKCI